MKFTLFEGLYFDFFEISFIASDIGAEWYHSG